MQGFVKKGISDERPVNKQHRMNTKRAGHRPALNILSQMILLS